MIGTRPVRGTPAVALALAALLATTAAAAQSAAPLDSSLFASMRWREVGPFRGGRTVAVAGSDARVNEYYMGTTGGGMYKTTDGGITWQPVTDKHFGGPIGAIAVAPSDPDIVYVGTGEAPIRGNVTYGEGVWKSTDAGKTWSFTGLKETRQISSIQVHPTNPDIVYVGAQGAFWGPGAERGVYKTTDGGKTWRKVLHRSDSAGVSDLTMDHADPNVLYAAFWQSYRTAWKMESGGRWSGLFRSTDGGETWTELTRNPGLPTGLWGKVGVSASPARKGRVWAIVESDSGGVFRSDDGGATWTKTNEERKLRQRAWYYSHIHADPKDSNTVYALNTGFYRSTDGGKTFRAIPTPHGDSHAFWISRADPQRMIEGNDGGANVSINGGRSWTEQDYATAQMYNVSTTNDFPYQICGGQQDNSAICIPSRSPGGIGMEDWYITGGCESGHVVTKPDEPAISFAGCYGGAVDMKDRRTGFERAVNPWPENPMGHSSSDIRYRLQWTTPLLFSTHDPDVLYVGGNVLFRTTNLGQSFEIVSPDLTRHDPKTMGPSGGPITKDQTGVETYATIFAIAESPRSKDVIWTGSDDGLVHVTRDGGKTWTNVTPKDIGDFTRISTIDASAHDAGTAYVAANRYQFGDLRPILYRTTDHGATWTRIDRGLPPDEPTRVVREDPERKGLLYAGTERSAYVSFDDGASWRSLKLNLPPVPVHDLEVKEGDLVAATHGRSFWILDDLTPLRQLTRETAARAAHLYTPRDVHRLTWGGGGRGGEARGGHPAGPNPQDGAVFHYTLAKPGQELTLEVLDAKGTVIQRFTSALDSLGLADSLRADSIRRAREDSLKALGKPVGQPAGAVMAAEESADFEEMQRRGPRAPRLPNKQGLNSFAWNLRHPDAVRFAGMIMWAGSTTGPMVVPGEYTVRLTANGQSQERRFRVLKDPRSAATQEDVEAQVAFLLKVRDRVSDANNAVRTIRNVKAQLDERVANAPERRKKEIERLATALAGRLSAVEGEIYQVRNQSSQDPLNYPIKLNNKLAALTGVASAHDFRPTAQTLVVFDTLSARLERELTTLRALLDGELARVNRAVTGVGLPAIVPSTAEPSPSPRVAVSADDEALIEKGERRNW